MIASYSFETAAETLSLFKVMILVYIGVLSLLIEMPSPLAITSGFFEIVIASGVSLILTSASALAPI